MKAAVTALLLLCSFVACGDDAAQTTSQSSATAASDSSSSNAAPARITSTAAVMLFTEIPAQTSGLTLVNVSGNKTKLAIPENIGQGAAAFDYDSDGDLDLYFANGNVLPGNTPHSTLGSRLYRNEGGFRFRDVTSEAGCVTNAWVHGAWAVDFDADGDRDLYLTVFGGANIWFENLGNSKFADATLRWGGADTGPSTAAAFFDADGDNDLDLYVGNYVDYDTAKPPNNGQPCIWRGLAVSCGPLGTTAAPDHFYENRDGHLVEATAAFGFTAPASYALGTLAADLDGDADTDLIVVNDSMANFLFQNEGGGKFTECALECGTDRNEDGRAQSGMGVDAGDVDNDGRFDFFITNFSHDTNTMRRGSRTADGRLFFTDTTFSMKLGTPSYSKLSWGTRMLDLDRDGDEDIVVVSGHVYPQVDGADVSTTYAQENQVFENLGPIGPRGTTQFAERQSPPGDAFLKRACSRGLVAADFDDDGDHDLLVTEMDSLPTLIRNDTRADGAWIGFSLRGPGGNREAIGTLVTLTDSSGIVRVRQRSWGGGFLSTSDPRLHFGLGAAKGACNARVTWPDGASTEVRDLQPGRYHAVAASNAR
ncbi:MAG: CRTAC1 family protein [Planctomycetes bacterium]|nr:CRTAC1 family protein [Planctomycetota bacterium]